MAALSRVAALRLLLLRTPHDDCSLEGASRREGRRSLEVKRRPPLAVSFICCLQLAQVLARFLERLRATRAQL